MAAMTNCGCILYMAGYCTMYGVGAGMVKWNTKTRHGTRDTSDVVDGSLKIEV